MHHKKTPSEMGRKPVAGAQWCGVPINIFRERHGFITIRSGCHHHNIMTTLAFRCTCALRSCDVVCVCVCVWERSTCQSSSPRDGSPSVTAVWRIPLLAVPSPVKRQVCLFVALRPHIYIHMYVHTHIHTFIHTHRHRHRYRQTEEHTNSFTRGH